MTAPTESPDPFQDRLNDYLDSELGPSERFAVESHLKGCEACRRTLQELREIVADAKKLPAVEPPPAV
ncbi:MAG TPA: zf-HC2 domain-containing protein, partial [Vicinamibacteria bacterium]